jgi:hypothetical protein
MKSLEKIKEFFCVPLLFALALLFLPSCEIFEDPTPDCEANSYGTVVIHNSTGEYLYVGITLSNVVTPPAGEGMISNSDRTYNKMPAGRLRFWASFDNSSWVYEDEILPVCDLLRFIWKFEKKKSTEKIWGSFEVYDFEGNLLQTRIVYPEIYLQE